MHFCRCLSVSSDGDEVTSDNKSKSPWSIVMRMSGRAALQSANSVGLTLIVNTVKLLSRISMQYNLGVHLVPTYDISSRFVWNSEKKIV